jgi:uncharacterized protein (DUF3084 family)
MPWWQDTYKYAKLVMSLVAKTDRHEADIKELRDEVQRLSASLQDVIFERQRDRDNAEHARQFEPCSTCLLRERVPAMTRNLTQAERKAIHQYIHTGQRINAIKTLRDALKLPLKDAVDLCYLLYPS